MTRASFIRSLLIRGAMTLAFTLVLSTGIGCGRDTSTDSYANQPTITMNDSTTTAKETTILSTHSTTTTSNTTSAETTTTEILTTTATLTTETCADIETEVYTEVETEPETELHTEVGTEVEVNIETDTESVDNGLPITESERILLCNLVAREYGANWISVYDKACVVAVVINRVNSPQFPNTIYEVLVQPNQFTGYLPSECYTNKVTDSCIEAVNYYFAHPDEFGNWLYFSGDGQRNYFR